MSSNSSLQTAISNSISAYILDKLEIIGWNSSIELASLNKQDALLIAWVIENQYVSETTLKAAIHEALCRCGKEAFLWHSENPVQNYPDHCLCPAALGYAIKHEAICSRQTHSIRFDHGEIVEKYIVIAEDLVDRVFDQLKNGEVFFDFIMLDSISGNSCDFYC